MDEGLSAVDPERILRLRYEDLIAEPAARLREIGAFSGLPVNADWDRRVARLSFPDRNDAWRVSLDPAALATITGIQASGLEEHGYV